MTAGQWEELPGRKDDPTCERCWHRVARWLGGFLNRNVCDDCKQRDMNNWEQGDSNDR